MTRQKKVLRQPLGGGKDCGTLAETKSCSAKACPPPCKATAWSEWGDCSETCGWGAKRRLRTVSGGTADQCGEEMDTVPCHKKACVVEPCNEWAAWGACSVTCGLGERKRTRAATVTGCKVLETMKCQGAKRVCPPVDCVPTEWGDWGKCSQKCYGGIKTRRRQVKIAAQYGGKDCLPLEEMKNCNTGAGSCKCSPEPGQWSRWSSCSVTCGTGEQKRTRIAGGPKCPVFSLETKTCSKPDCCVNCKMSNWGKWAASSLTCGSAHKQRSRSILIKPNACGAQCKERVQLKRVELGCCPTDCTVYSWQAWGSCSEACGPGQQKRCRSVRAYPGCGGQVCPSLEGARPCKLRMCDCNATISAWGAWTKCAAKPGNWGQKSRTRTITGGNSKDKNVVCPHKKEDAKCWIPLPPKDCVMNPWTKWSACSSCGKSGTQNRTRTIKADAAYGGKPCEKLAEYQKCKKPRPCRCTAQMSAWSRWSDCSKTCGSSGGVKTRTRTYRKRPMAGERCPPMKETKVCRTQECCRDCQLSNWENWSECDLNCKTKNVTFGTQTRTRSISVQPNSCGKQCDEQKERKKCAIQKACNKECNIGNIFVVVQLYPFTIYLVQISLVSKGLQMHHPLQT